MHIWEEIQKKLGVKKMREIEYSEAAVEVLDLSLIHI